MTSAPRRKAATTFPGTPIANSGIRLAPATALFAASVAATPSISPSPNLSGVFEARRAAEYPSAAATVEPTPGIAPMNVPMAAERKIVREADRYSLRRSCLPSASGRGAS